MEDTTFWNKKANDLTVGDTVKLTVATPLIMLGGFMLAGAAINVVGSITNKFRKNESALVQTQEQ